MSRKILVSLIALLLVLPSAIPQALAKAPTPPYIDQQIESKPYQTPEGLWMMPGNTEALSANHVLSPQETGGPDDFGYTWDDSVAMNWIDATDGTDTGMSGRSWGQAVGPVDLPFQFKYYENTYDNLYIVASGYLAFTKANYWSSQPRVPLPATPNNIIAPYATPLNLAEAGTNNRVYYKSGGTAPNRYFVVEWYQVEEDNERYTFEVILYENGDIVFQYQAMTYNDSYSCGAAGIEDSTGLDGLAYVDFCHQAPSNKAVRFYRPAPSARASVKPAIQGSFTHAGGTVVFQVPIRNTGDLGSDTYDLTYSSPWPVALYTADGFTPLPDTDSDGTVDTGLIAPGGKATIVVKVTTPNTVGLGDRNTVTLTVRSSLDTSKSKSASLQTAIPASFAQIFKDNSDGAMSLYLVQPRGQSLKKASADQYYGYDMAVAKTPSGFVYLWTRGRSADNVYVDETEYTLLDSYGNVTREASKLTDYTSATVTTYDQDLAVAVAPNGYIGVVWCRYLWNSSTSQHNYNIYFAILDSTGNVAYGTLNMTNNDIWGVWGDNGVPRFYYPRITATGDNRFVLAWERQSQENEGHLSNIYYAVRNTNGGLVKDVTKFTPSTAGDNSYYYYPTVTGLDNQRVLLAYEGPHGISYAVMDSAGNIIKEDSTIGKYGHLPDAVQLSTGRIVIAWDHWDENIIFAVLDGSTYNVVSGPTTLDNPAAPTGDAYVSVTADRTGHAILTWTDADWNYRRNLYYALVDGNGNILTEPMIFRTSQASNPGISTSYEGYGNTSWSMAQPNLPTSKAHSPEYACGPFTVTWSSTDASANIASYNIEVRDNLTGTWTTWLSHTTALSSIYTAVTAGHTYYFRSIAYDTNGNIESDIPADGDTHTTVAALQVEGHVVNNRHQPVFNASVTASPSALNTATTDSKGNYTLYLSNSGTYTLTVQHNGFGSLPSLYNLNASENMSGVDFVLPPESNNITNGNLESGDLNGWNSGPGTTPSVSTTAAHTGHYGVRLDAGGDTLVFWPYLTQTVSIPTTWTHPTLSFLYRTIQGNSSDALLATIVSNSGTVTHTAPLSSAHWVHAWEDLSAFRGQTVTLRFGFHNQVPSQRVFLDEISIGDTKCGIYKVYLPLVIRGK